MKPRIVFTGGGTAGHVTPNLALIQALQNEDWQIDYIGSQTGIERAMVEARQVPFHGISSGKLRRYLSWENLIDPFKTLWGIGQAFRLLRRLKTELVFSKGGFVAFPVVVAAWLNNIPVVAHESDISPGLANRLSFPFIDRICVTFAAGKEHFKQSERVAVTGTPIRSELFHGGREAGLQRCHFLADRPCLLVMGGGQGAERVNRVLRQALPTLTKEYQIIHLCGRGKMDDTLRTDPNYRQFEYAGEEMPDFYAAADLVISRAGANSVYEILALQKPHIFIPLSARVSRGDQIQNARHFQEQGISTVLDDDSLTADSLIQAVDDVMGRAGAIREKISSLCIQSATTEIINIIKEQIQVESPSAV